MSIMSKMNFDIKEDKLLWDGLVTININENFDSSVNSHTE